MLSRWFRAAFAACLLPSLWPAEAGVPLIINYQGRLVDGTNLVNGNVELSLRLYTVASGGTRLYEDSNTVAVVDGLYATRLGDNTTYGSLEQALDQTNLYIEVRVNGVALAPREPLVAVAFARQSGPRGVGHEETGLHAVVGGGETNVADGYVATIGGGRKNRAAMDYAVVGGGRENVASNFHTTVAGGYANRATGSRAAVGGGQGNTASGGWATVPGGWNNTAGGDYTFAAGRRAQALHEGSFVWGDAEDADVASTDTNQFIVRAEGGVGIGTTSPRQQLSVGNYLDLYSGVANDPQQASIRASVLGNLFLNARSNSTLYVNSDAGSNVVINLNGGHVGIGTNTAPAKLSVAGDLLVTEAVFGESFVGDGSGLTSLNGSNIAATTIGGSKLADNAVATAKIADNAVTSNKIANNAVGNSELIAGAVDTDEIVDGAVTRWKLQDRYWNLAGNDNATAGVHFVGTTGDEPVDFRVNNQRAFRLQPYDTYTPSVVGGDSANAVSNIVEGGVVAGGGTASYPNRVSDDYGVVGGGIGNTAGDSDANVNDAIYATVGGGYRNTAATTDSTVGGGRRNLAGGIGAAIGGGSYNSVSNDYGTVAGGLSNVAAGAGGVVGGGENNHAGEDSVVAGGVRNATTNLFAVIGGGVGNSVEANDGVIGGGVYNRVTAFGAVIAGGLDNTNSGEYGVIGGGHLNRVSGDYGTVGGGYGNWAANEGATVAGGGGYEEIFSVWMTNYARSRFSTVGGGAGNTAHSDYATVAGGKYNTAFQQYSAVAGGLSNYAGGNYAAIPGGAFNRADGSFSLAAGRRAQATHMGSFVLADSADADCASAANNEMTIRMSNGVRYVSNADAQPVDVGERFRDNAIVAWGRVSASGSISSNAFGVSAVVHTNTGSYEITLTAQMAATNGMTLIPMAIAARDPDLVPPVGVYSVRYLQVAVVNDRMFRVYIQDGAWDLINDDFVFMCTGR